MADAVIFDVDGTLINSVDLHARAWQAAFERFGKLFPYHVVRAQIGQGGDQLLSSMLTPHELRSFGRELDAYRHKLYVEDYMPRAQPFPLVRELFERLKADGVSRAIATSAAKDELDAMLKRANIEFLCDVVVSKDDVNASKPAPDVFQAALEKLGDLGEGHAIVVGDSPYDVLAAKRAGLNTIGLLSGGFTAAELRQAGVIALYDDPADLLHRYSSWRGPMMRVPVTGPVAHP